jgi:hypothetical protein
VSGIEWRSRAACRSVDPEVFFPTADAGPTYEAQVAVAKAVCACCPVRAECLTEALARIPYGIAGGLTPEERRTRPQQVGAEPAAVLEAGLRPDACRAEVEAAGRVLLAAGRSVPEVARRCGVAERTAARWAARARATASSSNAADGDSCAEGSRGGNRAPLLISHTHNPLAGKRAAEGHRG